MVSKHSKTFLFLSLAVVSFILISGFASAGFFSSLFGKDKVQNDQKPVVAPQKVVGTCLDSDGKNSSVEGTAVFSGLNVSSRSGLGEFVSVTQGSIKDTCVNKQQLVEFFCSSPTVLNYEKMRCPYGCSKGVCLTVAQANKIVVDESKASCSDSDDGLTYSERGVVTYTNWVFSNTNKSVRLATNSVHDYCRGNTLYEFSCDPAKPGSYVKTQYKCSNGCNNDRCSYSPSA